LPTESGQKKDGMKLPKTPTRERQLSPSFRRLAAILLEATAYPKQTPIRLRALAVGEYLRSHSNHDLQQPFHL
jgi:hypothetical protein